MGAEGIEADVVVPLVDARLLQPADEGVLPAGDGLVLGGMVQWRHGNG